MADDAPAWTEDDWAEVRVRCGLPPEPPQLHTYPWL